MVFLIHTHGLLEKEPSRFKFYKNYKMRLLRVSFANRLQSTAVGFPVFPMFDATCLIEQPSNELRLHTLYHGVAAQGNVSPDHLRAASRVCTSRHNMRRRFMVFDYLIRADVPEQRRDPRAHSTFPPAPFRADIIGDILS